MSAPHRARTWRTELPKAFEDCAEQKGSRVRTVVPKKGVTVPVCYPPGKGGKPVAGEPRHGRGKK
jgi:hypothetical protein